MGVGRLGGVEKALASLVAPRLKRGQKIKLQKIVRFSPFFDIK